MNNLQAEFEDNFYPHPHEDNDTKVCASNYAACNTCGKKYYYMNGSSCGHKKGSTSGLCDCGAQEEFDAQFAWFTSKLDAAVKEAEDQRQEAILMFFQKRIDRLKVEDQADAWIMIRGELPNGHPINYGTWTSQTLREDLDHEFLTPKQ